MVSLVSSLAMYVCSSASSVHLLKRVFDVSTVIGTPNVYLAAGPGTIPNFEDHVGVILFAAYMLLYS